MLWPTVSQSGLSWNKAPIWGLRPDFYCCRFVDMGCSLCRENISVLYNCCWPSPAQSFSGPSPMGHVTIFYSQIRDLPFHHLLWFAGLRWKYLTPPPHGSAASLKSWSKSHCDWQSVSQSWCRAPSWVHDHIFIIVWQWRSCLCGVPSLTRRWVWTLYTTLLIRVITLCGPSYEDSSLSDFPYMRVWC
jgi:hypothetical protein